MCEMVEEAQAGSGATVYIRRFAPHAQAWAPVRQSLISVPAGWTNWKPDCGGPLSWSPDFTKLLMVATPPGLTVRHAVMVDISTPKATFVDLTGPRQRAGFSDAPLDDTSAWFIADSPSQTVSFGSNLVVLKENGALGVIDTRNPKGPSVPFDPTGHPEYWMGIQPPYTGGAFAIQPLDAIVYSNASPGGRFIASGLSVVAADKLDERRTPDCHFTGFDFGRIIGWADATHAVNATDTNVGLVTAGGQGTIDDPLPCEPLVQPTQRELSRFSLTPDGLNLVFDATEVSGSKTYSVPASLPFTEPVAANRVPETGTIFMPGNY